MALQNPALVIEELDLQANDALSLHGDLARSEWNAVRSSFTTGAFDDVNCSIRFMLLRFLEDLFEFGQCEACCGRECWEELWKSFTYTRNCQSSVRTQQL